MSEITDKIISDLRPADFPSLPELLVRELEMLDQGSGLADGDRLRETDLETLPATDLFLSVRRLANGASGGTQDIGVLVRQCASRMGFSKLSSSRLRFLKQLYLQSSLTRHLAEAIAQQVLPASSDREQRIQQAGFCGLYLNVGALALEQVHGSRYLDMLQQSADTGNLLNAERREFGIDHAELGAVLMNHWGAQGFSCDAVRYHHHGVDEILDATALVRISWLANQLADDKVLPEAEVWADTLFDLKAEALTAMLTQANTRLNATATSFNIAYSSTRYLPLPTTDEDNVLHQEKAALGQLRERAQADSLFASARTTLALARTAEDLVRALVEAVQQLFGDYQCLLFAPSETGGHLHCVAGTPEKLGSEPLVIRALAERSVIANSCQHKIATFRLPESGLSVIDRQVLSLLETDNFCCEPCVDPDSGKIQGVLVMGIPGQQIEKYKKQKYLRATLAHELGRHLAERLGTVIVSQNDVVADYDRRIRETIHEVNNPLSIIKNYLQLLSMKQDADPKIKSEISFIKSEIDRVSNILEAMKSPPAPDRQRSVNINAVVTSLMNMFKGSFITDEKVAIDTRLDPQLPEILCSEDAIRQIITNLMKNAVEAFPDGGNIWVSTAGNVYMDGKRYIQLSVRDDGPGIAAEVLDRLFTSGNSTKGEEHDGSGLSIVNNLVKNLGGQISCRTNLDDNNKTCDTAGSAGTEFTVILPVTQPVEANRNTQ